jgi:hypothetical protein
MGTQCQSILTARDLPQSPALRVLSLITLLAMTAQASGGNAAIGFHLVNDPAASKDQGTSVNGINFFGVVTGGYGDANNVYHAMVSSPPYDKSEFVTINGPGAPPLTNAWGINFEGTVTGYYVDAGGVFHGFVSELPYKSVLTLNPPGACSSGASCANLGTEAFSINLLGTIAGYYVDANSVAHGFVSERPYTLFKVIDAPGACSAGLACANLGTAILANSLNDLGTLTGVYYDANGVAHGFVSERPYQKFKSLDVPGACSSGPSCYGVGTQATSINLGGTITGMDTDTSGVSHGFVSEPPYTQFRTLDAPGACASDVAACAGLGTSPQSIDLIGTVTGFFADSNNVHHGFVAGPPYRDITVFDAPGVCSGGAVCAGAGTAPYANDVAGGIAGTAYNSAGVTSGFVARQK